MSKAGFHLAEHPWWSLLIFVLGQVVWAVVYGVLFTFGIIPTTLMILWVFPYTRR